MTIPRFRLAAFVILFAIFLTWTETGLDLIGYGGVAVAFVLAFIELELRRRGAGDAVIVVELREEGEVRP